MESQGSKEAPRGARRRARRRFNRTIASYAFREISRVAMNKTANAFVAIAGILATSFLPAWGQSTSGGWSTLAPVPTPRQGISVAVLDPATDRWQSLDPMPEPRHGIFAGVIGNIIYIPGGGTRQGLGATNVNSAFHVRP